MNITLGLVLLLVLLAALVYTTIYYARTANWRKYAAGQSFMAMLGALDALVGYTFVARFFPLEVRTVIFSLLMLALTGAVIFVQRVMRHEYKTARAEQAQTDEVFEPKTDGPTKGEHSYDEH